MGAVVIGRDVKRTVNVKTPVGPELGGRIGWKSQSWPDGIAGEQTESASEQNGEGEFCFHSKLSFFMKLDFCSSKAVSQRSVKRDVGIGD